jgi:hypothetical protein
MQSTMKRKKSQYLYFWNSPRDQYFVASGITVADIIPCLEGRSLVLMEHQATVARHDSRTCLDFINKDDISLLLSEDIYSWGTFSWADIGPKGQLTSLTAEGVAELLYFGRTSTPLRKIDVDGLDNSVLVYCHDDGWYLKIYYSKYALVETLLKRLIPSLTEGERLNVKNGECAYWIQNGKALVEEMTFDVDAVINRNLHR